MLVGIGERCKISLWLRRKICHQLLLLRSLLLLTHQKRKMARSKLPFQGFINNFADIDRSELRETILYAQSFLDSFHEIKRSEMERYDRYSNESGIQSSNALITLATVMIPVVLLVISQEKIFVMLHACDKWLVVSIISLLIISVAIGVIVHAVNGKFFHRLAVATMNAVEQTSELVDDMDSPDEIYVEFAKNMQETSKTERLINKNGIFRASRSWQIAQYVVVSISGILLMILLIRMLF